MSRIEWCKPKGTDVGDKSCLVTILHSDSKTKSVCHANPRRHLSFYGTRIIAQAEYPKHFIDEQKGWLSTYLGDEEPNKDGNYIVSYISKTTGEKPLCGGVVLARYLSNRALFSVGEKYEAIAWMPVPSPFSEVQK